MRSIGKFKITISHLVGVKQKGKQFILSERMSQLRRMMKWSLCALYLYATLCPIIVIQVEMCFFFFFVGSKRCRSSIRAKISPGHRIECIHCARTSTEQFALRKWIEIHHSIEFRFFSVQWIKAKNITTASSLQILYSVSLCLCVLIRRCHFQSVSIPFPKHIILTVFTRVKRLGNINFGHKSYNFKFIAARYIFFSLFHRFYLTILRYN